MPVAATRRDGYEEILDGLPRRLILTNAEIERFEQQYAPLSIYEVYDGLVGQGRKPQARHVRDLVALALVGGGMRDRQADDLIAALPVGETLRLYGIARAVLGLAFHPTLLDPPKKKRVDRAGQGPARGRPPPRDDMVGPDAAGLCAAGADARPDQGDAAP